MFVFRFEHGQLAPAKQSFAPTREGAGPRHLAFHPSQPWVYVINELDSTVAAYTFDAATGALRPFQVLSALADSFAGNSRASEIEVDLTGRTLYASNRGEDSIAVFDIDLATGRLKHTQSKPCAGRTPRFFTIEPSGRWLYCLNEDSDAIVQFSRGALDAKLMSTGRAWHTGSPVCMIHDGP